MATLVQSALVSIVLWAPILEVVDVETNNLLVVVLCVCAVVQLLRGEFLAEDTK